MKKRVFYVVNLDRSRIWILALLLVSTLLFAFATGFRVGQAQSPHDSSNMPNDRLDSVSELDRQFDADGNGDSLELAELRRTTGSAGELADDSADLSEEESLSRLDSREYRSGNGTPSNDNRVGASPFEKNPADRPMRLSSVAAQSSRDAEPARKASSPKPTAKKSQPKAEAKPRATAKKSSPAKPKAVAAKAQPKAKPVAKAKPQPKTVAVKSNPTDTNPRSALLNTKSGTLRLANPSAGDRKTDSSKASANKSNADRNTAAAKTAAKPRSYSLQLGAFSSRAAADRMAGSLKKQGFHPRIETARGRHIVRVGRSDTARGLWKLEQGLRKKQYAPMRVSTGGK